MLTSTSTSQTRYFVSNFSSHPVAHLYKEELIEDQIGKDKKLRGGFLPLDTLTSTERNGRDSDST